uniref:Right-handed parallel beta-helix repeat-containing protein n=1 Tax=candidate division WOR-3 bacterium TaxID=2052148 RepID=A0A7C4GEK9_UNCW3
MTIQDSGSIVTGLALTNGRESGVAIAAGRHRLERCLIAGNRASGIVVSGPPGTGVELNHCTIADNPLAAIFLQSGPARLVVRNSIIAFNDRALALDSAVAPAQTLLERNCLHNLDPESDRVLAGKTGILADPAFLARSSDYRLSPESPCLNKTPERNDLGCFP